MKSGYHLKIYSPADFADVAEKKIAICEICEICGPTHPAAGRNKFLN
jgi:hypothetical protein